MPVTCGYRSRAGGVLHAVPAETSDTQPASPRPVLGTRPPADRRSDILGNGTVLADRPASGLARAVEISGMETAVGRASSLPARPADAVMPAWVLVAAMTRDLAAATACRELAKRTSRDHVLAVAPGRR